MLTMLLAYNESGDVVATLDYLVRYDDDIERTPLGLVDFAAHEAAGGKLRDVWDVEHAAGSGTWPEWIGAHAHEFRVELQDGRIVALEHRRSGYRRERASVEAAIAARIAAANGAPADIRDIVGGPSRPLELDPDGRTIARTRQSIREDLPLVARRAFVDVDEPR